MTEFNRTGPTWSWLAVFFLGLMVSVSGYFVRANDKRIEKAETRLDEKDQQQAQAAQDIAVIKEQNEELKRQLEEVLRRLERIEISQTRNQEYQERVRNGRGN